MINNRNINVIDIMKCVCSILIVTIHTQPLKSINYTANFIIVDIIARIAVPYFFVCSGYFFFIKIRIKNGKIEKGEYNNKILKKYIRRLLVLYIFYTIFYLFWWIPFWYNGDWLNWKNIKGYIISIFINGSYYHLWYPVALIYGILFTYFILRFVKVKFVFFIATIFYLIGTFSYSYTWLIKHNAAIVKLLTLYDLLGSASVGVFRAFPFLMIGYFFAKFNFRIKTMSSIILSFMFLFFTGIEAYLLRSFSSNKTNLSYIFFTGVTAFFIFNVISKIELRDCKGYLFLRQISTIVYFTHPMFINLTNLFFYDIRSSLMMFIIVLSYAFIFSILLIWLSNLKHIKLLKNVL